jgi:threonine aldolase
MVKIDLRSDTVTHPTREMRQAMYEAELGDDVYGDDPTTNALQEEAAELLGKDAALLVASGTQGNLVSLLSWATRGDEVLVGDQSHIFLNEAGGASALGGLVLYPIQTNQDGFFSEDVISQSIKPRDYHKAPSKLLCLENTHNSTSGRVLIPNQIDSMVSVAKSNEMKVHMDGARLFNAVVYLGINPIEMLSTIDSVTFCLSKGLSCPIGSIVAGDKDFIDRANRWRKMLGSGMRQVGVIAAAGRVAIRTMIQRLEEDHINAKKLAYGLANISGLTIDAERIQTNIVRFQVPTGKGGIITDQLYDSGVYVNKGIDDLRMVTHRSISNEDIDFTLLSMEKIMGSVIAGNDG